MSLLRSILAELELNDLINRSETLVGHKTVIIYKVIQKGIEFCDKIIGSYEKMFPRKMQQQQQIDPRSTLEGEQTKRQEYLILTGKKTHQQSFRIKFLFQFVISTDRFSLRLSTFFHFFRNTINRVSYVPIPYCSAIFLSASSLCF
jgi:hypothetical protein